MICRQNTFTIPDFGTGKTERHGHRKKEVGPGGGGGGGGERENISLSFTVALRSQGINVTKANDRARNGQPRTSCSNWILMSCQPHRVTSGQSNSGHKQIHISKLFSHILLYISTLCQVNLQNQSLHKHKGQNCFGVNLKASMVLKHRLTA